MSVMEMPRSLATRLENRGRAVDMVVPQLETKLQWLEQRREAVQFQIDKAREYISALSQSDDSDTVRAQIVRLRALVANRQQLLACAERKIARVRAAIDSVVSGSGMSGLGAGDSSTIASDVAAALPTVRQVASQLATKKGRQTLLKSAIAPAAPPEEPQSTVSGWWVLGLVGLVVGGLALNSLSGKAAESAAKRDVAASLAAATPAPRRRANRRRRYMAA